MDSLDEQMETSASTVFTQKSTRDSAPNHFGAPIRGTGNQGAKTTRNQAIRHAAGYCWMVPESARYYRILPEIARNCMRGRGDRILPDFAGFCKNIAGYCRTKRPAKFGNVRQYSATMGLPDITRYYQLTAGNC